ncbi:hypothetical protein M758_11G060000 [Ceratodon purpureus]|uniref:Uncharacterized protein n=1 Tax=Ceratodon purpureus TaxID=3225 RepID=A0A8T0GBJ9_CERPU|nr:hypothetical protein KC19_11G062000 [Ceratodon purpureus]KAG0600777.1 hypothetical protein M758_11G060000 [Ceratodon purpureus]
MAGVWYFNDGVAKLVPNPYASRNSPRKILVHRPSNEMMTNFEQLDAKLLGLGWHPYYGDATTPMRQYHLCSCTSDLLTLPPTFNSLRTVHMYDIVVKTRSTFQVRDAA